MTGLARDGTAEPVSRDQILKHEQGQGKNILCVQVTTNRIGNTIYTRSIHTLQKVLAIHTFCTLSHMSAVPIVGVGKERRTKNGPWWALKR